MKRFSIRLRIAFWNSVAFAIVLLVFGVLVYALLRQVHFDQLDRFLTARYQEMRLEPHRVSESSEWESRLEDLGHHAALQGYLLDSRGRHVVGEERRELSPALVPLPPFTTETRLDTVRTPEGNGFRRLVGPLPAATEGMPREEETRTIVLLAELGHLEEELALVRRTFWFTAPISLLLAAVLAYALAIKALTPVEELRRRTNEITAMRLERRLPISHPHDELGMLAATFNALIARLEKSFGEIRRFTADASHELRTPVAVIRSEAELALADTEPATNVACRLESIIEECLRLSRMTDQLLILCREDVKEAQRDRYAVELESLVAETIEGMRPIAERKQQQIRFQSVDQARMLGDAEGLRQAISNLLANAIKFTDVAGEITVVMETVGTQVRISVNDTGPGIQPHDVPHVFDRFYRATSEDEGSEVGAGLGLSIVKAIVNAHDGEVTVVSQPGNGSTFQIVLPIMHSGK